MSMRWQGRRVGIEIGNVASEEAFDILFFQHAHKISNKAMAGMVWGDKQAIGNIYKAVIRELTGEKRNGLNVEVEHWDGRNVGDLPEMIDADSLDFRYAATRRLEYVVRRTQPMWDMLDRSVTLSNPGVLERSIFIFRTALEAQENVSVRALSEYAKSSRTLPDKKTLTQKLGAVIVANFAVAIWKNGFKWAVRAGIASVLAAFGIHKYYDKKKDSIGKKMAKDGAKNVLRLNKFGKFAVDISERIAESVTGEGYNWNRNTYDVPILDTLQTGAEATAAVAKVITDMGYLDNFVEEITNEDKKFNEQLFDTMYADIEKAIRASFEFGVRIKGVPILAPVQEFLRPALQNSKIKIIREVTYGDVDNPTDFSDRVFSLYEKRKELNKKAKTEKLSSSEARNLRILNDFTNRSAKIADRVMEISDQETRKMHFEMLELGMSLIEDAIKEE
jgi:hypothetical protein